MTYAQIITAHAALQEFGKNRLPFPEARKVFGLARAVKNEYDFYTAEEQKLVREYAKKDDNGAYWDTDGRVHFETPGKAAEYLNARTALQATECEITPITIPTSIMGKIEITPEMLEQLDGVIEFGGDEPCPKS